MADFREAFRQGLAAYDDAERARNEISGLLDEFAEQVREASDGKVQIERGPVSSLLFNIIPTGSYLALVAVSHSNDMRSELCAYSLGDRGYPVTLRYAKEDVHCFDREALELGLQKLLAHPETGGKLQRLMGTEQAA